MKRTFLDAVLHRRSVYTIGPEAMIDLLWLYNLSQSDITVKSKDVNLFYTGIKNALEARAMMLSCSEEGGLRGHLLF